MTGEPIDIGKDHEKDPFLLSGTAISEGSGRMIVVAVGSASQWGVILKTLIVEPNSTPLQDRLDVLVVAVGNFGIGAAILTFIASVIRWIVDGANGKGWEGLHILEYLINSVTIVVVAIPEGLPLAITLGLAFAMRKMMADQNLVRRLEACETMGSATQLNADKTGTLTQNRMTVTDAFLGGKQYDVMPPNDASHDFAAILAESCCINSDANLERGENDTVDHIGSKTECALLQLVEDLRTAGKGDLPASENFAYVACRKQHQVVQRYHFTSARKRMSTAIASPSGSGTRLHCKGASEIVVKMCKKMMKTDGSCGRLQALRISRQRRRPSSPWPPLGCARFALRTWTSKRIRPLSLKSPRRRTSRSWASWVLKIPFARRQLKQSDCSEAPELWCAWSPETTLSPRRRSREKPEFSSMATMASFWKVPCFER
jgi:Ca2+-transporting ATPase